MYTYIHIHIYTYIHICIYAYMHMYMYTCTNIHECVCMLVHIHPYSNIHIYIYTYIHIYIYTSIHIYAYTPKDNSKPQEHALPPHGRLRCSRCGTFPIPRSGRASTCCRRNRADRRVRRTTPEPKITTEDGTLKTRSLGCVAPPCRQLWSSFVF